MDYIYGFLMSWGMFTVIPCPYRGWKEEARGHMLVCFPLIGALIGGIWYLMWHFTGFLPIYLRAVLVAVVPWFLTGFMHLDGFMDVSDAVMSRRDLETRQRILKDSKVGAFAVICISVLIFFQVAGILSFLEIESRISSLGISFEYAEYGFIFIPIASRICAAFAVLNMKPMHTSQYSNLNKKKQFNFIIICMFIVLLLVFCFSVRIGISVIMTMLVYIMCVKYGSHSLGGMNGDISGYALTIGELAGIIGLII